MWKNSIDAQQELNQCDFYSFDQKKVSCLSRYLFGSKKTQENQVYQTDSQ